MSPKPQVLCVMQRGLKGVCFVDALDKAETGMAPIPDYGSNEYYTSIYGETHASVLSLLEGTKTEGLVGSELANFLRVVNPASLQLARETSPLTTGVVAQLFSALRLFSFG